MQKSTLLIAIDSGKYALKSLGKRQEGGSSPNMEVTFRTKVKQVENFGQALARNSYLVKWKGKEFLIGEMVSESEADFSLSKTNEENRISIYVAIAQMMRRTGVKQASIKLAVNMPAVLYGNQLKKEEFQCFLQQDKQPIVIEVNHEQFAFVIEELIPLPEAMGPIYAQIDTYRNKRVLVIDIGSRNTSINLFNQLVPQVNQTLVSDLGIYSLRSTLAEELSRQYGYAISDDDAEQILHEKRYVCQGKEQHGSKELINRILEEHLQKIIRYAESRGITFNNITILFVGGGSILLRDKIMARMPLATITDRATQANVLSFMKILEAKQRG